MNSREIAYGWILSVLCIPLQIFAGHLIYFVRSMNIASRCARSIGTLLSRYLLTSDTEDSIVQEWNRPCYCAKLFNVSQ